MTLAIQDGLYSRLERLHEFNPDLLRKTLHVIVESWSGQPDSFLPEIVEGVALYMLDRPGDPNELIETLAALRCGPSGLLGAAKETLDRELAYAVADQIKAIHR